MKNEIRIAIIGLGYVGLPLARLFATRYRVTGFDINKERIKELQAGYDRTLEVSRDQLLEVLGKTLFCTDSPEAIRDCNVYIITVPTPADRHNRPDLGPLKKASETVARALSKGDVVVYESTVYPGATEEDCIPVVEAVSGLKFNRDFFAGYSPERINPGDKEHSIDRIRKVTSGSTPETAEAVDALYGSVIAAGTHRAPSIRVAEAAKIIENCQRDINIAFVNELKKIFDRMEIDTHAVLEAAGTKWNFLRFHPGLVGGHCIGVDPYYLTQKAQEYGYHPEIISAGRRLNDSMGEYIGAQVVKQMIRKGIPVKDARGLVMGFTFKANCPDVRNTQVVEVVRSLEEYGMQIQIYDPWANPEEVRNEYRRVIETKLPEQTFDAVVVAVAHARFREMDLQRLLKPQSVLYRLWE
jgi:UDP-N-acetyl-D-galactosamine dehydrogenase